MRRTWAWCWGFGLIAVGLVGGSSVLRSAEPTAAERGRVALTSRSFLAAAWGRSAYESTGRRWETPGPDPIREPESYARAFRDRYGLHPSPYPNDGLPMGLRTAPRRRDASTSGLMIDCMVCHGGSIGDRSYVGLGNSQLDLTPLLRDLTQADGQQPPLFTFTLNTARGTVNAGMISAMLLSLRNADLTKRRFPLPLAANLPELDVPPWWHLKKKRTMYYDGRTDARAVRTNMQFMLGELTPDQFRTLEPTFRDIQAYFLSIEPPRYPFPIDRAKADRGRVVFERTCSKCHGTYGPGGSYPNVIVELDRIGTDPARAKGLSDGLVAHYNATWFGQEYPTDSEMTGYQAPPLDGIWATAPYLHNGSVPTVAALLKSSERPKWFRRPPSTAFDHFDTTNLGWKFEVVPQPSPDGPPNRDRFLYDTTRYGLSNGGHTFCDKLSDEDRQAVIEYLKTL